MTTADPSWAHHDEDLGRSEGSQVAEPTEVDRPRRPLAVAVQTVVAGNPHGPLGGHEVYLGEVLLSDDRPMTRFGSDQRSHTVPWALTRRAAAGLAGRSAKSVWCELKSDINKFQKFRPKPRGAAQQDYPAAKARWDDIVRRLDELPDQPPAPQSLQEWRRNLGDLVSGYIEMSQLTSFASFAYGRAVYRGEAAVLERLDGFQRNGGAPPRTEEVVKDLLDIKQGSPLPPEDVQAAKEHLIRSLHRAYPKYMTSDRLKEIQRQLGLKEPVTVHEHGQLPGNAAVFTRYPLRSELVAEIVSAPHDPSRIGRIMLSEQSRPDTQFSGGQGSHAASWSLMRASLLSFEGGPHHQLETWLGHRFDEMDAHGHLDEATTKAVGHARRELATLDMYPPHERETRVGDLVRIFVSAHQKLPHTTFIDELQIGQATPSGELDFGLRGGPRHDELVASHFDGAAPFNMHGDDLDNSYRSWRTMAERLGPIGPRTVALVADRTFSDKPLRQLREATSRKPINPRTAKRYLAGLAEWDRAVTTVFPNHGPDAVAASWGTHSGMFSLQRFGEAQRSDDERALIDWFAKLRSAPHPSAAAPALAALTRFYDVRSDEKRRAAPDAALQAARAQYEATVGAAVEHAPRVIDNPGSPSPAQYRPH